MRGSEEHMSKTHVRADMQGKQKTKCSSKEREETRKIQQHMHAAAYVRKEDIKTKQKRWKRKRTKEHKKKRQPGEREMNKRSQKEV